MPTPVLRLIAWPMTQLTQATVTTATLRPQTFNFHIQYVEARITTPMAMERTTDSVWTPRPQSQLAAPRTPASAHSAPTIAHHVATTVNSHPLICDCSRIVTRRLGAVPSLVSGDISQGAASCGRCCEELMLKSLRNSNIGTE